MTHEQLLAFVAVASQGTFSGASARLHKSQPAVSKLVRNLEEELGLLLFDRTSYRPTLTRAGQLFLERATGAIETLEALRGFGRALAGGVEPTVRLAIEAVTPLSPVMAVLKAVQARYPALRYELRTVRGAGALEALRDASADLVLCSTRGMDARIMEAARFTRVRVVAVAHRDHPLGESRGAVPAKLLRLHPQVVLRDSGRDDAGHSLNVLEGGLRWTVSDVASKHEIIRSGMGWGGLPEHVVASDLQKGVLVPLEVREFDVDAIELSVLRRRDRTRGPAAELLWTRLQAAGADAESARAKRAPPRRPRR